MSPNPLFYSLDAGVEPADLHDQIQIALAIADPEMLRSLLLNCLPSIAQPHQIGAVSVEVGVPTGDRQVAEGVLHVETIQCVLAASPIAAGDPERLRERDLARLTQYESELHAIGQHLALAPAVALLAESGLAPKQIEEILRLPQDGWHKSWWRAIESNGNFTQPFLRQIRVLRYPDGGLTLQYKDFFEQTKPPCFARRSQPVLIALKPDTQGFSETLKQINYQRDALGITPVVLLCSRLSELEAQAFVRQGVSVYPAIELVLPTQASCIQCGRNECPMNGLAESTVSLCRGFLPVSEFV